MAKRRESRYECIAYLSVDEGNLGMDIVMEEQ